MPGQAPPTVEPISYLVDIQPTLGPLWTDVEDAPRHIEAFPIDDGQITPRWVELPRRRIVNLAQVLTLPVGARKLPLYDPTGSPVFESIEPGTAGGRRFLFVSEGYGDDGRSKFFTDCRRMAAALFAKQPFKTAKASIRIDGLFLPLRGSAVVDIGCGRDAANLAALKPTLFGTQSCFTPDIPQLWAGDEDRARALVAKSLPHGGPSIVDFDFLAVLINSAEYGGAGSSGPINLKPRVAWATTGHSKSPDVLLHELGHAFGLQDEYAFAETRQYTPPPKPWRNISAQSLPENTPWEKLVNQDRQRLTHAAGTTWGGDPDAVGTFQGAGYDPNGRYRPSDACRVRNPTDDFCPVCSEVILAALDPTAQNRVDEET